MPRATTRNKASQSQSQSQSQTQSRQSQKRKGRVDEDEDDDVEEEQDEDEEMEDAEGEGEGEDNSVERKANNLVRLALFTEYRRTALKRDEIAKKVLGGRATKGDFQPVFDRAQHILRKTFAMELHEIMSRAERDKADAARDGAKGQDGDTNVTGLKKKGATASSKQYILRSLLHPTVIEAASVCDAEIVEAERAEIALWHPDDEDRRPEGTLIAWKRASEDQLGAMGVLHVILALILINGRVLTDMQLRTYMKRLRLPTGAPIPSSTPLHTTKTLTIDAYLAQLLKQSYLDKQKTSLASTQGGGQKRPRGAAGRGDDGDTSFEWKWGTRAIAEISEEGVGAFIADFMEGIQRERERRQMGEEGEGSGGGGKKERERLEKRKEKLVTAIGRAAGGGLTPFA